MSRRPSLWESATTTAWPYNQRSGFGTCFWVCSVARGAPEADAVDLLDQLKH
jgi:hypothetical protein